MSEDDGERENVVGKRRSVILWGLRNVQREEMFFMTLEQNLRRMLSMTVIVGA